MPERSASPLRLTPSAAGRPWGGGRFGTADGLPVGELWVSGDESRLPDGRTLAAAGLAASVPLVKLLDVDALLSVQVHPDDALARALHGPGAIGKHEMWVVLEARDGAYLYLGLAPGSSGEELFTGDARRVTAALVERRPSPRATFDVPPGAVHAPGPGLLLYEIQQRSDLTYRAFDWGRPRPLHHEEASRALRPTLDPAVGTLPARSVTSTDGVLTRVSDPGAPFALDHILVTAGSSPVAVDPGRAAILSVTVGSLRLDGIEAPAGSHWYLPHGAHEIAGEGEALLAHG
jgi:mannose-6-phosphate isomerase